MPLFRFIHISSYFIAKELKRTRDQVDAVWNETENINSSWQSDTVRLERIREIII